MTLVGRVARGDEDLATLVRRFREERGLSQNQLSRDAGLAPSYVNQLESGARGKRPSRNKMLALAHAMRLPPDETAMLLRAAGLNGELDNPNRPSFEQYIHGDPLLRSDQKEALVAQYRTYVRAGR